MEEIVVTRFWMAGVIALMIVYAVFALMGVSVAQKRNSVKIKD